GVSFVHVEDAGQSGRQELGVDVRTIVHRTVTLAAFGAWSTLEERLAEANLQVLWQPCSQAELTTEVRRTAPDLFGSHASVFAVLTDATRDELGGTLWLRPLPRLRLQADGYVVSDDAGTGGRGGLRATWSQGKTQAQVVGAEFRALEVITNGYVQARAFT